MIIKNKKAFWLWAAVSLLCMIFIFWFSSQNADESSELSGSLSARILDAAQDWFSITISEPSKDIMEVAVRKAAHFFIYFVFGFCTANTIRQITDNRRYIFGVSLCWCSLYAATDEWHQYFVPGRSCMWQDWLLDTSGVLLGVGTAFLAVRFAHIVKNRKRR